MMHVTPHPWSLALLLITLVSTAPAGADPLRILYLGDGGQASADHCHVLMRDLGRDAVWFDYHHRPGEVTAGWIGRFDAVLLDAPAARFPALAAAPAARVVTLEFPGDWRDIDAAFVQAAKDKILGAVDAGARRDWETFLAGRQPERREPNPNIANYERRSEPVTFQDPFPVPGSIERTQVPVDLRLELFAAEPDIAKPIALAWDERGRLWICETRDYPHDVDSAGRGRDSIKICEDTNGDGRADKFTVFADQLNIPTSLVFVNGGVMVTQPPRLLFLQDTDGDDVADRREVLMEGWGIGDTHAQANSLHYGFDNWIYGCVGYSGFRGTVDGRELRFAQGTFRFRPDGSGLEFLHQFSNNSWGQSVNESGDQFGGTANNAPIFFGGIPASLAPQGFRVMSAKKINEEYKAHTITPNFRQVDVFGGFTAAAGSAFIHSPNMPPRLQGMAMVCEPTMKIIALMDVQPDGAGYTAKDGFNLVASSDEWMSPVFAEVGPDGAVWFADWQNYIIQHNPTPSVQRGGYNARTGVGGAHENPLRDHERGRIYRVVWEGAKPPATRTLAGANPARLTAALNDPNPFWRLTAQRLLVQSARSSGLPAPAITTLKASVTSTNAPLAAVHALWTLHGAGVLDADTHRAALLSGDSRVRRNAVRALGADAAAQALYFSSVVVSDPDLNTRLAALVKLAEFETSPEIKTMVSRLAVKPEHASDEWLAEATRLLAKIHQAVSYREGPNLLPNPGFEITGDNGLPEGWTRRDYQDRSANRQASWTVVSGNNQARTGGQAVHCVSDGLADTSLYVDVTLKPNTQYRLSGWVKSRDLRGKLSLNDHLNRHETERLTARDSDWTEVEVVFRNGDATRGSINILHVARGEGYFDDVKLAELLPLEEATTVTTADPARGREIFFKHAAACVLCHQLGGEGSTVGPPLDGIAARKDEAYLMESLVEPSKVLAEGYQNLELSPMPPMGDIFNAQQMADILAFLKTLKSP